MVALEAPSQPAAPPPLSPGQSAFLAAYVEAKSDILAAARKLQIPLEAALTQFADPALQAHLALLDESGKRAARETAVATINRAAEALTYLAQHGAGHEIRQKAAANLARAALWLVRIAEGKVGPDSLPQRYARQPRPQPERPPPSGAEVASANLEQTLKSLERLRAQAPEILARPHSQTGMQPDRQEERCAPQPSQEPPARVGATGAGHSTGHVSVRSESRIPISPRSTPSSGSPSSLISRAGGADSS